MDKLDYCANLNNLKSVAGLMNFKFVKGDIGRGLHSSTFQLNLSAFYRIRGAPRGYVARVKGEFRVCRVLCVCQTRLKLSWKLNECKPLDIGSADLMTYILKSEAIDTVMHFAAQTHVDNSFGNSFEFTENNIRGTHVLLEAGALYTRPLFSSI